MRAEKARSAGHEYPPGDHGHAAPPFLSKLRAAGLSASAPIRHQIAPSLISDASDENMAQKARRQAIQEIPPPAPQQGTEMERPAPIVRIFPHSDDQYLNE